MFFLLRFHAEKYVSSFQQFQGLCTVYLLCRFQVLFPMYIILCSYLSLIMMDFALLVYMQIPNLYLVLFFLEFLYLYLSSGIMDIFLCICNIFLRIVILNIFTLYIFSFFSKDCYAKYTLFIKQFSYA